MAKTKANTKKKSNAIVNLKIVIGKLQRSLSLGKKSCDYHHSDLDDIELEVNDATYVPDDVKEGHFAVIAVDEYEFKRFVVPLSYLSHPSFLELLEQAAEEYGFDGPEGALMIPCRPSELERMLMEGLSPLRTDTECRASCTRTMVTSC